MTTYISTKDVAKLVRGYLKVNYPADKFSVRSDHYAGGSAVRVSTPQDWTLEQTHELWDELAPWGSAGFDGMTDSSYSKGHYLCPEHGVKLGYVGAHWGTSDETYSRCCDRAESVSLGASYVTVQRSWK